MSAWKLLIGIIFFFGIQSKSFCQEEIDSEVHFSIRLTTFHTIQINQNYNLRLLHTAPNFTITWKNHNFYLGPQFTYVFQPLPIAREVYEQNPLGINLGYRYYSKELVNKMKLFGQFNFSIYQVKYTSYALGGGYAQKRVIVENSASLGIDYNPIKNIHIFSGVGFGSLEGFFLMVDTFALSGFVGLEYKF